MATNRWASTIIGQQEQLDTLLSRLGTAAGADLATDIATVDTVVDGIDTNVDTLVSAIAGINGISPATAESKQFFGRLSIDAAAADFDAGATDFSSSNDKFFAYNMAAVTYIHRMTLVLENGDYDETAAMDASLFVGGATALSAGIIFGNDTATDFQTANMQSPAATTIASFADRWGAQVTRHTGHLSATNNINHDTVIVTVDFEKIYGAPIVCAATDYFGIYLNDDLSALTHLTGVLTGRIA